MFGTPEYRSWCAMIQRCENPSSKDYSGWGARGVRIHPEWRKNFAAFLAHIGPRPLRHSVDRIDNGGHYEPGNVRWATPQQQARNSRRYARGLKVSDPTFTAE
jgi:hypothetical protein